MTRAIFIHATETVRDAYEQALGIPVAFVNKGGYSASYSENTGLARDFPTLDLLVKRYIPDARPDDDLVLLGFSAGCWAVRHYLRQAEARKRCSAVLLIDGLHSSSPTTLAGVTDYALEAKAGRKVLVISHSQIRTDLLPEKPYHSTRQTADVVMRELGLARGSFSESVHDGGFHVLAGEGGDAKAHSRQLVTVGVDACTAYVRSVVKIRDTEPQMPAIRPDAPLRERALAFCLAEHKRWGGQMPTADRRDDYLLGCERSGQNIGAWLAKQDTPASIVNFCAAAQGWAEHQALAPGEEAPPWRAGAKELMADARAGRRGRWVPVEQARDGWRPPAGALAIYHRGPPGAWTGHVDRCTGRVEGDRYECVGANEGGRRWNVELAPFSNPSLLGFIVDGLEPERASDAGAAVPEDFTEPELTPAEQLQIRGLIGRTNADALEALRGDLVADRDALIAEDEDAPTSPETPEAKT